MPTLALSDAQLVCVNRGLALLELAMEDQDVHPDIHRDVLDRTRQKVWTAMHLASGTDTPDTPD